MQMKIPCLTMLLNIIVPLVLLAGLDVAKAADNIPANAHARVYGEGWVCDLGYLRTDQACSAIDLPENAYLTDDGFDTGWRCSRSRTSRLSPPA